MTGGLARHGHGARTVAPRPVRVLAGLLGAMLWAAAGPARAQAPAAPPAIDDSGLPASALAVRSTGGWSVWWRSDAAPRRWSAALPALDRAVEWHTAAPGLEWGELTLAGDGAAWRIGVVLARMDPRRVALRLAAATRDAGLRAAWSVDSLPAGAVLGVNAGQFTGGSPWGWVVRGGRELQPPGAGPLSAAVVVDREGRVEIVPAGDIPEVRRRGTAVEAFQSYPLLLDGEGSVPPQLAASGRGVDLEHRDSRLAIGELRDGRILLALTRFAGLGEALSRLPFGPTTPEMAAILGALGCRRAVLLDGGLSGQLVLRDARGGTRSWPGLRAVPLALIAYPRPR